LLKDKTDKMESAYILCDGAVNIGDINREVKSVNDGRNP